MKQVFLIKCLLGVISLLFIGLPYAQADMPIPEVKKGQIDLRYWDFEGDGAVELRGEWKFYWRQFLYEDDFPDTNPVDVTSYITLPSIWNGKQVAGKKLGAEGYASFRLNVLLNRKKVSKAALRLKTFGSACKIYVNGKKIYQAGKVGRSADETEAYYAPAVADFIPDSDQLDIVVQVANFEHRSGGAWFPIKFGTEEQLRTEREQAWFFDVLILGAILIMGIYHFGLYYLRRQLVEALYFGGLCFMIGLRTITTGEFLLHYLIGNWNILIKIEYLTFYLSIPLIAHFVYSLFPNESSNNIIRLITAISLLFGVLVIILPPSIFTHTLGIYQIFSMLSGIYLLIVIVLAIKNNRRASRVCLSGAILLFMAMINDILYVQRIINTGFYVPMGIFAFVGAQALTLAFRFTKALQNSEELSHKLNYTNQNLEHIVQERTKSLEKINRQLSDNQVKLQRKNEELIRQQEKISVQSEKIRRVGQEVVIKNSKLEHQKEKLRVALEDLKTTQTRLIHSEKMASLGQLTAGMAHEINNPINFVYAGVDTVQTLLDDLVEISDKYAAIDEAQTPEELEKVRKEVKKLKILLNYGELKDDIAQVLIDIKTGANRTMKIVKGLRTFSRLDEDVLKIIDLHENLDVTLNLLRGEYESRIRITKDYDARITNMEGYPGQLNQVFMNLLLNAIQAIPNIGTISISTEYENNNFVKIIVKDTGKGIPESYQPKIFDPFFTYGKSGSTGLGLAISHSIIEQHRGEIKVESQENKGTSFIIRLPITQYN